ncbi:MAG: 2-oxoacid:acceptor oxidoreductase family protein [Candidatus Ozemobacteraceae bacterium]
MIFNVIITGIGGQGVVTAAGLLRLAVVSAGYRLTGADNRGGAQRLGHVSAVLRLTDEDDAIRPLSPEIPFGTCHLLVSLEASEGLRFSRLLGPETVVVMNRRLTVPTNRRRDRLPYVTLGECHAAYSAAAKKVIDLDADRMAGTSFKKPVLGNLIALGAGLSCGSPPGIVERITSHLDGDSLAAFRLGYSGQGVTT